METCRIIPFVDGEYRSLVAALWNAVFGYEARHNDPNLVIDRKLKVDDGLFFVAVAGEEVVGTVMAGYDGHRGWIYSLAVAPAHRRKGIGTRLTTHAERALIDRGCVKINLQIIEGNEGVVRFYQALGYTVEPRISMGKRIPENIPES